MLLQMMERPITISDSFPASCKLSFTRNMTLCLPKIDLEGKTKGKSLLPQILPNHQKKGRSLQSILHLKRKSPPLHKPKVSKLEQFPPSSQPIHNKVKYSTDIVSADKNPSMFDLQKELDKVKIVVPLFGLLRQPSYKAQVSQFIDPPATTPV